MDEGIVRDALGGRFFCWTGAAMVSRGILRTASASGSAIEEVEEGGPGGLRR